MKAMTSRSTPVNMAHHSYYNLAGHGTGRATLFDHTLTLPAPALTPPGPDLLPTGEIRPVAGTRYDLRAGRRLGEVMREVGGLDHNWVVRRGAGRGGLQLAAILSHPPSATEMRVLSNQPGIQVYTGNFLPVAGLPGKEHSMMMSSLLSGLASMYG